GLAKTSGEPNITKLGSTVGTVSYMSPEQTKGEEVDHRTDIWSFGVVLYEMLSGQLPFKGDYEQAVIYSILNEEPTPLLNRRSDVPKKLQDIVQKAISKNVDERFQSVDELLKELIICMESQRNTDGTDRKLERSERYRKLSALMFTDMIGYSALTQKNESLAIELLEAHRQLLRPLFQKHGGNEVETIGDAFFVEFKSALEAVRCAIKIQKMLHRRNSKADQEKQIILRIGLHIGDVIHIGKHVHGDGVNIAARLEPLSAPGGICLSEDVVRQIKNKIELPVRNLGTQKLKNIESPVEIYCIEFPWESKQIKITKPAPGRTISHYKILAKLGEGGMGKVYKAEDTKLERTVAIKFLPHNISANSEERERFKIEAKAAAALNHPNIATIYAIEEFDNEMFIVMEFIDGKELKEEIKAGPIQSKEAINIATQIAEGLIAAHKKEIIHRDIKSSNIMITKDGKVKIMDFGLAKIRGEKELTKIGSIIGTAAYMSPEQTKGDNVDHRTDIWSFGVVLYEMLTGQLPFRGDYEQAVIYSILNDEPESVTELRDDVPNKLIKILEKTLQKEANARYQNIKDMSASLKKVAGTPFSERIEKEEKKSPSIAVLPFVNISADPENEYFSDGLAEDIISALTKLKDFRVAARTSAFSFKGKNLDIRDIGKKLSVETVLEGSVRKAGNRLRITAQLTGVVDGYHLWSEQFDREMADIFAIQDEITLTIVEKLKVELLGGEKEALVKRHTDNLEAYHLYLKGRYFGYTRKAVVFFERAIEKDSAYALAYSGLADIYSGLGMTAFLPPNKAFTIAKTAAEKALEIDDTLAEAHCSLGLVKFWLENNWVGAKRYFQRAIHLDPGYAAAHCWFASLLVWQGETEKAIAEVKQAQKLDPLSSITQAMVGFILYVARRFDEAIEHGRQALEIEPDSIVALYLGALPYKEKQMYAEAISLLEKAVDLSHRRPFFLGLLGHVLGISGNKNKARKILEELVKRSTQEYVGPLLFAWLYLGLGDNEQAIEWFEKAFNEGQGPYHIFFGDSVYDGIRSTTQFRKILKKIGIEFWATQPDK
ncbi:protein kinase, partial [candidate division KSB1 bacterium]|nr:protein kinase [candidate division KSB1 bacterium]